MRGAARRHVRQARRQRTGRCALFTGIRGQTRGDGEPRHYPGGISGSIAIASSKLKGICEDIDILCEDHGLDEMQRPDFGILDIMYEWADGGSLGSCLYGTDMTGGDFVRTAKRLADVLQQIAVAQPLPFDGESGWQASPTKRPTGSIVAWWPTPAWTDGGRLMGVCQPTSEAWNSGQVRTVA